MKFNKSNLDHNWLLYILEDSHTLLSHDGSGMTVHMMGTTYCTVHHKFQPCILGDNCIHIEPRMMVTLLLLYVRLQTEMLTVLTGDTPKAWTTDTVSSFLQACVTVRAMLKTRFITVASPQTNRTWFTTMRTLMGKRNMKTDFKFLFLGIQTLMTYFPPSNSEFNLRSLFKKKNPRLGRCSVTTPTVS